MSTVAHSGSAVNAHHASSQQGHGKREMHFNTEDDSMPLDADGEEPAQDVPFHVPHTDAHMLRSESPGPGPDKQGRYHMHRDGVKMSTYTRWLKEELDKEASCMELPFTIVLLIAFSFMALYHLRQDQVSIVENAIAGDIEENANFAWAHHFGHKGIDDVNSYGDFWSWTRLGLLPLLTIQSGYSEDLQKAVPRQAGYPAYDVAALPYHRKFPGHRKAVPIRNDYLRYNRIIGGFRLRQRISVDAFGRGPSEEKCIFPSSPEAFKRWFGKPCAPTGFGQLPPDLDQAEDIEEPMRTEWILTEIGDLSKPTQALVDMEDGCVSAEAANRTCLCKWCASQNPRVPWLNEVTERVEISFVVLNPQHGLYSLASVNFWFNKAGHIYKLINIRSAWIDLFARPMSEIIFLMLADGMWALMCLYVIWNEVAEVLSIVEAKKKTKVWYVAIAEDYLKFWNIVDWISIMLAITIVALGARNSLKTWTANSRLADVAQLRLDNPGTLTDDEFRGPVVDFYDAVSDMLGAESQFRFQLVLYPSNLMLRLFKSFAAQPRLAIVTETFVEAQSDIFHFIIVFCSVYVCMSVNAVLFFGQDSEDFATFPRAWHACFLVMFGDWDYDQMEQIGRRKAGLWFWMFMIIVVLILQNIMLAILMEAYTNVKFQTKGSMTLWEQIHKQWRRFIQARRKERVRLNDIFDAILMQQGGNEDEMLGNETILYPEMLFCVHSRKEGEQDEEYELRKANDGWVPHLKEEQAVRTMTDAQRDFDNNNADPFEMKVMEPNLTTMMDRLDNALVCSSYVDSKIVQYDEVESLDDPSRTEEKKQNQDDSDSKPKNNDTGVSKDSSLREGVMAVSQIAQKSTSELSDAMGAVLAEEMQSLERRQKEQQKSMEQMQASLQSLRSLAYKLSQTCAEVAQLSAQLGPEAAPPDLVLERGGGGEAPDVQVPAGAAYAARKKE